MANNRLSRLAACLLIGLGGCSSLLAQYELKSGVYNSLSQRVPANNTGKIAPVGPTGTPLGDPTILPQYSNVVGAAGSAGPIASGYPKSTNGIKLSFASVGTGPWSGQPAMVAADIARRIFVLENTHGLAPFGQVAALVLQHAQGAISAQGRDAAQAHGIPA